MRPLTLHDLEDLRRRVRVDRRQVEEGQLDGLEVLDGVVEHLDMLIGRVRPFILVKVEGGLADWVGDTDVVEVVSIDYDVSESTESAIEELDDMIGKAERIPDRLAQLPHDDPRWIDKPGILASLREDLAANLQARAGEEVFITDDGIVPRCDICGGPQLVVGDDWNGETGAHYSCEDPQYSEESGT